MPAGKLRFHLSGIPGVENTIQTPHATSTTFFKVAKMAVATWRAIFHGSCNKRALIIKKSILLPLNVSLSVIHYDS
jgi:hypothetical protein